MDVEDHVGRMKTDCCIGVCCQVVKQLLRFDVIMKSQALLTDVVLVSLESLAIAVGVAFIGLRGVKLVSTTVSSNFTNFLVQLDPTPYL
jgi:hypothetical protein